MIGCSFVADYRSPSQNRDEYEPFPEITLGKLTLNNPFMLLVIGDLNAKPKNTYVCNIIEIITSHFVLHKLIRESTYILEKSSWSIDLIYFSTQDFHSSLYANCRQQIVFAKYDLKIYYLQPYESKVWLYQEADSILIRWEIYDLSWKRAFPNWNVDEKATVFNRTTLNILENFAPYETLVGDGDVNLLEIIFHRCLETGTFQNNWKKDNVVFV